MKPRDFTVNEDLPRPPHSLGAPGESIRYGNLGRIGAVGDKEAEAGPAKMRPSRWYHGWELWVFGTIIFAMLAPVLGWFGLVRHCVGELDDQLNALRADRLCVTQYDY